MTRHTARGETHTHAVAHPPGHRLTSWLLRLCVWLSLYLLAGLLSLSLHWETETFRSHALIHIQTPLSKPCHFKSGCYLPWWTSLPPSGRQKRTQNGKHSVHRHPDRPSKSPIPQISNLHIIQIYLKAPAVLLKEDTGFLLHKYTHTCMPARSHTHKHTHTSFPPACPHSQTHTFPHYPFIIFHPKAYGILWRVEKRRQHPGGLLLLNPKSLLIFPSGKICLTHIKDDSIWFSASFQHCYLCYCSSLVDGVAAASAVWLWEAGGQREGWGMREAVLSLSLHLWVSSNKELLQAYGPLSVTNPSC